MSAERRFLSAPDLPNERARLRQDWDAAFGSPPDTWLSPGFMQKALTWHRQCAAAGGFPPRLSRRLTSIASGRESKAMPTGGLAPGNLLAREWNGRLYHVEVLEDGFRFDGQTWSSLSAVARRITGTAWSGPRFFGLTTRRAN